MISKHVEEESLVFAELLVMLRIATCVWPERQNPGQKQPKTMSAAHKVCYSFGCWEILVSKSKRIFKVWGQKQDFEDNLLLTHSHTWRFPSNVHHLDVGAHLQQRLQELVGLAVEGAREHLGTASISGGRKFGHMKRRQRGELSAHLLSLRGEKTLLQQQNESDNFMWVKHDKNLQFQSVPLIWISTVKNILNKCGWRYQSRLLTFM